MWPPFLHFIVVVLTAPQTWNLAYFPMNQYNPYDRYGDVYNISRILDPQNRFNLTAYEQYSPLYLPATFATTYLFAFVLSTCVLVHTLLYHGPILWKGIKKMRTEQDDTHAKLMRNYPEVPDWWYIVSFVLFYCVMIVIAEASVKASRTLCAYDSAGMAYVNASLGIIVIDSSFHNIRSSFWLDVRHDRPRSEGFHPGPILALICVIDLGKPTCPNHPRHTVGRKASSKHGKQSYSRTCG